MSFSIGDTVDAYRILEELGRGGMGQVFKVEHTLTRRLEAMKVLKGGRPDAPGQATRSLREIQVQARLDHPNIAAVHHAFWLGADLVLVMELIEGCSLQRLLETGRVPLATAIDYACQALSALSYAHAHGVIHRDVSPSNMMVSPKGVLKLTDFGLSKSAADARFSQPGAPIGSLYYMSPEQVRGAALAGEQSDIYSLGAVLYELVTGKRPFEGSSAFAIMVAHVEKQPVSPADVESTLSAELNDAILRALAKDPAERFQSAEEFRQVLVHIKSTGIKVSAPSRPRRSWVVAASVLFAVATFAVADFARIHGGHKPGNPPAAVVTASPVVQAPPPAPSPALPALVETPHPPPSAAAPAKLIVPVAAAHAQVDNSRTRTVAKRSAPPKTAPTASADSEPAPKPSPGAPSAVVQPPPQQAVAKAPEPPPLKPAQAQLPAEFIEAQEPLSTNGDAGAAPKPPPTGVKKGLSKFWHLLRGKKPSSQDTASSPAPDNP